MQKGLENARKTVEKVKKDTKYMKKNPPLVYYKRGIFVVKPLKRK